MVADLPNRVGVNECGGCTACCDLFPVEWLDKPINARCQHACVLGCAIHDTKPAECSGFSCAWLQSKAPTELRPDNCGVVFEKLSDRLFYGTVFKPITAKGAAQVHAFVEQGFSVILFTSTGASTRFMLHPEHDESEIRAEFQTHVGERYGDLRD